MSPTVRKITAGLLLVVGVQLWLIVGRSQWGNLPHWWVWAAILIVSLVPALNRLIVRALDRVATPTPRTRLMIALAVAVVAGGYLYFTALRQQRDFFPKILDEGSYAIQARMLAAGRLWMEPHPAAESFDSAYVLVRPVYASMYFPGTALALVPGAWAGAAWWVTPLLMCAASAGVLYRVVTELVDGVAGLLSALMLVSLSMFRELSLRLYSQVPMLLLALLVTWAWLAWRRDRRWWRAMIIGALGGWMLIVRPIDAVVFLLPLGVAMALDLGRFDARTIAALAAGALPFLSLQLIANRGITGSWLTTPHAFYAQRDFPGVTLGFHDPRPVESLATRVPQKRELYEDAIGVIEKHRPETIVGDILGERLRKTAVVTLPNNLLLILLPFGALALATAYLRPARAWAMAASLPLFVLTYAFYLFYMAHYIVVVAPAVILLIVLAARRLPEVWPAAKNTVGILLVASIVALAVSALPEFDRTERDDLSAGDLGTINEMLKELPQRPAIVLFRYGAGGNPDREPVYNFETLRIDDAEVIRAHDLPGEKNRRLLDYYASRQPQRHVYRIVRDPAEGTPGLTYLGPVADVRQRADEPL